MLKSALKKSGFIKISYLKRVFEITNEAKTIETMDMSLIRIFKLGPEVSLKGSPTVSQTTPALCAAEPLPP